MDIEVYCGYPFNRVRVTCEGNLAMCCFQRDSYIGNVLRNTFDEVWFGEIAEDIRAETLEGRLHKRCQMPGCPYFRSKPPYPTQSITYNEYPTFLEIDLPNTHCNVGLERPNAQHPACIMCERAGPPGVFNPETDLLEQVLPRIAHLLPNLSQIHIQGIAEPFYKDILFNMLDWLGFDSHRERIIVSTTTNGTLFHAKERKRWLERCPHSMVTFSIDAATPETFKKIRILPVFERVLENLYAYGNERNVDSQFLRIHNNINTMNVHEVMGMVQIAAKANVNCLEFNPTDGFRTEILVNEENCGRFKKAHLDIVEECERLGVTYNFIRPLDLGFADQLVQITL